jgi:DNA-nicking Smr family endonuclease
MTDSKISKDEQELFREAMQGVRPLKASDKLPHTKSSSVKPHKLHKRPLPKTSNITRTDTYSDHISETVSGREVLFFARSGLQEKILRLLRSGKLTPSARLDLHGMTIEIASNAVNHFLQQCIRRGCQCVWIIHGKGDLESDKPPPLKNHVNNWLRQEKNVLAFSSAQPRDGGTGAVYVLLRHQR